MSETPQPTDTAVARTAQKVVDGVGRLRTDAGWVEANYLRIIGIASIPLGIIGAIALWFLVGNLLDLLATTPEKEEVRDHYYALGATMTGLGALLAAPFFVIKAWINERNTRAAQKQTDTAEQGLITDRLTKAIEQLGAEKTVKYRAKIIHFGRLTGTDEDGKETYDESFATQKFGEPDPTPADAKVFDPGEWQTVEETVPNLEVRLGAIYALERIAEDSERDHIAVMETLCAYIRENAPARSAKENPLPPFPDWPEEVDAEVLEARKAMRKDRQRKLGEFIASLDAPRADIQAALTAIGRRKPERIEMERRRKRTGDEDDLGFQLDLRGTNLQKADLRHASFDYAILTGGRLEGAELEGVSMTNANLIVAHLDRADLSKACLIQSYLNGAQLEGARLFNVDMEEVNLYRSRLQSAVASGAMLERAFLLEAQMEGTTLAMARMNLAVLSYTRLEQADLVSTQVEEAKFSGSKLMGADLFGSQIIDSDFRNTRLDHATFGRYSPTQMRVPEHIFPPTRVTSAFFDCSSLRSADLSAAQNLSPEQVRSAFGVRVGYGRTLLPDDLSAPENDPDWIDGYPAHWHVAEDAEEDSYELGQAYEAAYQAWLATLDKS